jgi:hypothetical protein
MSTASAASKSPAKWIKPPDNKNCPRTLVPKHAYVARLFWMISCVNDASALLDDSATYLREDVVRVRPNESYRPHDDDQNDSQHHRVLGNVLTLLVGPQVPKMIHRVLTFTPKHQTAPLTRVPDRKHSIPSYSSPRRRRLAPGLARRPETHPSLQSASSK